MYKIYAGYLDNNKEILECSSGGIATALSRQVIRNGGYVVGVSYSENFYSARYEISNDEKKLDKFKGSKYIQVEKEGIHKKIENLLEEKETVLFFGLPCMVASLKAFLKKEYDNLITCDLVCHGPTDSGVHREYVEYLEKKYGSKIVDFSVRKKKSNWFPAYLYAKFEDGRIFEKEFYKTEYGFAFKLMGKEPCYHCKYKVDNNLGDIMIGDFLGAKETDPFWNQKGVSVVLVKTEKGEKVLEATEEIRLYSTTFERAVEGNPMIIRSKERKPGREKFEKKFKQRGLIYAAYHSKYLNNEMKDLVMKLIPRPIKAFVMNVYQGFNNS